ncbi:MAG: hypothetical protein ACOC1X_02985 [Promethearchaeota archaeon]
MNDELDVSNKALKVDLDGKEELIESIKNDDDLSHRKRDRIIQRLKGYHDIEMLDDGTVVGVLGATKSILNSNVERISPTYHTIESRGNRYKVKIGASEGIIHKTDLSREWYKITEELENSIERFSGNILIDDELKEKILGLHFINRDVGELINEYNKYASIKQSDGLKGDYWFKYNRLKSNIEDIVRFPSKSYDIRSYRKYDRRVGRNEPKVEEIDEIDDSGLIDNIIKWIKGD